MTIKELAKRTLEASFRLCPARMRVLMKQVRVIEPLDYPGIYLDIQSWLEYRIRRDSCRREEGTMKWVEKMQPGDVLYDVGANVGVYSMIAAKRLLRAHAFEPMGITYGTLLRNIQLNQLGGRIQPWMIALSDETGVGTFNVSRLESGTGLHAYGPAIDYLNRPFLPTLTYQVLSYRMDDFVERYQLPKPTHIKIDVDGIEFKVLKGAERLLPTVKSVMVELENEDQETGEIIDYLRPFGLTENIQHKDYENVSNWEFSR